MADLANNPQGGEAVVETVTPSTELAESTPASDEISTETTEESTDVEQPEEELDEAEWEGKKYKLPKAVIPGLLRQADYTKKTTEVAERARALEAREQFVTQQASHMQEYVKDQATVQKLDDQLAEYSKVTREQWAELAQKDPGTATRLQLEWQMLRQERETKLAELNQKVTARKAETERAIANRISTEVANLSREIKGYNPKYAEELSSFAQSNVGFTPSEVQAIDRLALGDMSAKIVKLTHLAYTGQKAIKELAALKKAQTNEALQPVAPVGTRATGTVRRTTDSSGDKLSIDEWMRQEAKRTAANRR
jgi:fructose-specific component phosphotransferase system IIB-like protein